MHIYIHTHMVQYGSPPGTDPVSGLWDAMFLDVQPLGDQKIAYSIWL